MVDRTNPDRQVRGAKLRTLVLDATIARIEAVGIDNVRIADIAEAAGVHETSLYRRWKTLSRLLVDALVSRTAEEIPIPDTGSVESDLETFTTDLARFAQTPAGTAMIRSTVVSDTDPEVEAARREFWLQRLSAAEEIIKRGIARGEVAADADAQLVVLTLGGLVHLYVSHIGEATPADLPQRVVRLILPGIAPK